MFGRRFFQALVLLGLLFIIGNITYVKADASEVVFVEDTIANSKKVILPNDFAIVFGKLVPNRIKLNRFRFTGRNLRVRTFYYLPDHQILGLDNSFAIQIGLNYRFNIEPVEIKNLVYRTNQISQDLGSELLKARLADFWYSVLRIKMQADQQQAGLKTKIENYIQQDLKSDLNQVLINDGIQITEIMIEDINVPDQNQYRTIVNRAPQLLNERLERLRVIEEAKTKTTADELLLSSRRKHLEQLGVLLNRYPNLREYIAVDQLKDRVNVIVMPYDRFTGNSTLPLQSVIPQSSFSPTQNEADSNTGNGFKDLTPP